MATRIMLDPDAEAPNGWIVTRTGDGMMRAINEVDPVELVEISMRADVATCMHISEQAARVAMSAFHLLGGMSSLKTVRFHHHDLSEAKSAAEACRQTLRGGGMDIQVATDVPLGDDAVWWREKGTIVLRHALPEAIAAAVAGGPVSRLIRSPMLPRPLIVREVVARSTQTTIMLED